MKKRIAKDIFHSCLSTLNCLRITLIKKNNMIKHAKTDVSGLVKPKRRITALIAVLMLMCLSSAFAQGSKKVTGTVNDAAGEPMIGVSIVVKGTTAVSYTHLTLPTNSIV